MSVFDLDTDGQAALAQQAQDNAAPIEQAAPGFFHGVGTGVGQGVMRGGAKVARALGIAATAPVSLYERATDQEGRFTDPMFDTIDDIGGDAVDYWTPNSNDVGAAGRVLGGLSEIVLPLMAGGGNPALLMGSVAVDSGTSLVDQGVDANTAVAVGTLDAAATGIGFKLPFLGKSLLSKMATGTGGNLALGAGGALADQQILEARDYEEQAKQFDPLNVEARLVDLLTGIAFGGIDHLTQVKPSQRDAALTANNAKHFQQDTSPGLPADWNASTAHQNALEAAVRDITEGRPVNVTHTGVTEAEFVPVPRDLTPDKATREAIDELGIEKTVPRETTPMEKFEASEQRPATALPAAAAPKPAGPSDTVAPDIDVIAAQSALAAADLQIHTGEIDVDGLPKTASARSLMQGAQEEIKVAQTEAKAFDAAVTCYLSSGA